jgi:predicted dehydrogenase
VAPLTIGIVGTGSIARVHLEALRALGDQAEVIAAADSDDRQLREFCAEYQIAASYPSLAALLAARRPDLVHVCTPPFAHAAQALACLQAGCSVLVEKPPALSLRDLAAVTAAEQAGGPWFATVFQHRFGSGARRLRALIDSGLLGRPLLAVCHTVWFRDQAYFDVDWRGRWDTEGGGPTMGHGIHQMDLLLYLLGDWVEVSALARRQARKVETEDLSLAQVSFASGAVASVVNSVLSPREESYLRIDFERATVELTHLYGYGDDDWRITPAPGCDDAVAGAWRAGEHGTRSGHQAQFTEVLRALRADEPPPVRSADSALTTALVTAVYASAFTRRPVTPADLAPGSPWYDRMQGDGPPW